MCQKHILDAVKYNGSFLQTSRWLLILRRNSPLCEHYYSKMKVSSGGQQHKMFYSNADCKTKSPLPTKLICPYDHYKTLGFKTYQSNPVSIHKRSGTGWVFSWTFKHFLSRIGKTTIRRPAPRLLLLALTWQRRSNFSFFVQLFHCAYRYYKATWMLFMWHMKKG